MLDLALDKEIDADDQEHLRVLVRRAAGNKPMTAVAAEAGVKYGTFSSWMGGTYAGNTNRIAAAAQGWLDAQEAKARTRKSMPTAPSWVETPTGRKFQSAFQHAQHAPDLVVVAGGAGVGKTAALKRHAATHPNVFILTGEPCFSTPRMVLDCLGQVLGLTEKYSSQTVSRAIQRRLVGSGGLIIVDEAQHLSSQSLDQMRTLHDLSEVGIALVGNETVFSRLEGYGRLSQFAQLHSRVGMRITSTKPSNEDISLMLDAWNVADAEVRRLLTGIAKQPGALRGMTKTLKLSAMIAAGEPVTKDLILSAWQQISASKTITTAV